MRVPRHFVNLMEKGNPNDPLFMQVMPLSDEFLSTPGYTEDPLEEHDTAGKGILHKYDSRVLLMVRTGCAVNCRYCFRRHFPYADNAVSKHQWEEVLSYIRTHTNINEVIFSGGDPLMAKDDHLAWLAQEIAQIEHVKRLRIHTRLPVVLPERLDDVFIDWFGSLPLQRVLVLHANHARELTDDVAAACDRLTRGGIPLLSQSVLLKGVNADADTLTDLFRRLIALKVKPYYLHHPDRARGTARFRLSLQEGRDLVDALRGRISGLCQPNYVVDIPGGYGKAPTETARFSGAENLWRLTDFRNRVHDYRDV